MRTSLIVLGLALLPLLACGQNARPVLADTNGVIRVGTVGSELTALNGTQVTTGTVAEARIDAALLRAATASTLYQGTNANLTTLGALNGGSLTNLNATNLVGTIQTTVLPGALGTLSTWETSTISRTRPNFDPAGGALMRYYDGYVNPRALSTSLLLRKLKTNYTEFAVYVPSSTSQPWRFTKYTFSDRVNKTAGTGALRLVEARESLLYPSTNTPSLAQNFTTGVEAENPVSFVGHASATSVSGSWTGPQTNGLATNVYYTATAGDYVSYDVAVTNGQRIVWETYQNISFGHTNVLISVKDGGVDVASTNFTVLPAISIAGSSVEANLHRIEVAHDLPAATYTVRIEAGAGAGTSRRTYDRGISVYNAKTTNSGSYGTWISNTNTFVTSEGKYSAARIYPFTGTKVKWFCQKISVGGFMGFKVIDSTGVEVDPSYYDVTNVSTGTGWRYVDTYSSSTLSIPFGTTIAHGLTGGVYYLVLHVLNEKNASSSNYRVFDYGIEAYTEGVAGTVGTDVFDDQAYGTNFYFGMLDVATSGGNIEWAPQVKETSSGAYPTTEGGIVTGVHGAESVLSGFWIKTNETAFVSSDWSNAVLNASWVVRDIDFGDTASVYVQDGSATNFWATTYRTNRVSASGYTSTTYVDVLRDIDIGLDYRWMVTGFSPTYTYAIGGGINRVRLGNSSSYALPSVLSNTVFPFWTGSAALEFSDGTHLIVSELYTPERHLPDGSENGVLYVRSGDANTRKIYWSPRAYGTQQTKRLTASDDWSHTARWRFIHSP